MVSPIIRVTQQQLITSVIAGSAVKVDRLGSKLESVDPDMVGEISSLYSLTGGRRARSRIWFR
jgi:hypothetical protein